MEDLVNAGDGRRDVIVDNTARFTPTQQHPKGSDDFLIGLIASSLTPLRK
jgi:hypothetical protein